MREARRESSCWIQNSATATIQIRIFRCQLGKQKNLFSLHLRTTIESNTHVVSPQLVLTIPTSRTFSNDFSNMSDKPKVILAYSGGLDTSVILKWLTEKGFEVICFCANVGQFEEDFAAVKAKAVNCGATKCIVTDLRKEFVTDYVFEAIKCNALYEGRYLLGTSLARPCITKEMMRIAAEEGAKYVAHGATGKGNDQVRFEMCAQALNPMIQTIAPWRDAEFIESFKGRSDLLAYCTKHGIPVDAKPKANYSIDENLYHTSYESGMLEDAACSPDDSMFKMTVSPKVAPEQSDIVRIEFEQGVPVKISNVADGTELTDPLDLFLYCNKIAGKHGVGRIDIVENRFVGIKSRGVYETPGGSLLRAAHLDLEGICMDREVKRITEGLAAEFSVRGLQPETTERLIFAS